MKGYGAVCADMAQEFGPESDELASYYLAWTCALGPTSIDDLSVMLKNAQDLVRNQPTNPSYKSALGILLYRHGDFEQAMQWLTKAVVESRGVSMELTSSVYPKFFLAMSHWQLGRLDDARRLLTEAQLAMDEAMKASPAWNRRLTFELFRREAEALIQPTNTADKSAARRKPRQQFGRSLPIALANRRQ